MRSFSSLGLWPGFRGLGFPVLLGRRIVSLAVRLLKGGLASTLLETPQLFQALRSCRLRGSRFALAVLASLMLQTPF